MKKYFIVLFVLFQSSLLITESEYDNKIAFLRNGEVWVTDINGKDQMQLTASNGTVIDFKFSPTLKFLAYNDTILNLVDNSTICLHSEMEGYTYLINKWFTSDDILFSLGGNYEVIDMVLYNKNNKSQISVFVGDARSKYANGTTSDDRSIMIYTRERFPSSLYYTDLSTGHEKILVSEKSYYSGIHISKDNQYVLALSCINYLNNKNIDTRIWKLVLINLETNESKNILSFTKNVTYKFGYAFSNDCNSIGMVQRVESGSDKIFIYDIEKENTKEVAAINLKETDKYGFNRRYISWSPEDTYIMSYTYEDNKGNAAIVEHDNPAKIKYFNEMGSFDWVSNNSFLYNDRLDVYCYDLKSDTKRNLLRNATHIVILRQSDNKK